MDEAEYRKKSIELASKRDEQVKAANYLKSIGPCDGRNRAELRNWLDSINTARIWATAPNSSAMISLYRLLLQKQESL